MIIAALAAESFRMELQIGIAIKDREMTQAQQFAVPVKFRRRPPAAVAGGERVSDLDLDRHFSGADFRVQDADAGQIQELLDERELLFGNRHAVALVEKQNLVTTIFCGLPQLFPKSQK